MAANECLLVLFGRVTGLGDRLRRAFASRLPPTVAVRGNHSRSCLRVPKACSRLRAESISASDNNGVFNLGVTGIGANERFSCGRTENENCCKQDGRRKQFVDSLKGSKDQRAVRSALETWFHEAIRADWKSPADVSTIVTRSCSSNASERTWITTRLT